jgi:putative ABC transport system permease protein
MAWRDSRKNRSRLLLFISSIVIGIAALVAINSFSENLQNDINKEAKTLLGADLIIQGSQPVPDTIRPILDSLRYLKKAESMNLVSMVFFPKNEGTRLTQVRALEGEFPFYGKLSTVPVEAGEEFIRSCSATEKSPMIALVEKTLMLQFNLSIGDSVKVGNASFLISGQLNSAPGRAGIAGSVAPVVYIAKQHLESTGLVQRGSLIYYQHFYQFPDRTDVEVLEKDQLRPLLQNTSLEIETISERREDLGEAFGNMRTFLNLVGFIALLLGCIGVASSVHIYIKDKLASIAVLRCIGTTGWQAFRIFLIQVIMLGIGGGLLGVSLGSLLQIVLPAVLGDFLPVENVSNQVSLQAVVQGLMTGLAITILFALLPLLKIRRVSPMRTLRSAYEADTEGSDPLAWVVYVLIFLFIGGFTMLQTGGWESVFFPLGIGVAFLALAGVAKALTWAVRRFFPTQWSYTWRQSIANLYRPNNQTLILIVTIGLGTALISTLFLVQDLLLKQVAYAGTGDVPNMIIFDIQPPQVNDITKITNDKGLPVKQVVPIVTMRVDNIDGVTLEMNRQDTLGGRIERERRREGGRGEGDGGSSGSYRRNWVYEREYRVTYRDSLIDTEKIVEGTWYGEVGEDGIIYISLSDNVAESMKAKIGSKITFNVQGALLETVVGSIRKVDFARVQTNFLVLFPKGVLEEAPQFYVVVSRVESEEQSAGFQRALVKSFPNVSVIDLTQILKSVETVLDKVSFVIRFMAFFSILTGLIVLVSSVILSKYQRIQESVLLRTLGANRKQILKINALEYFLLGSFATLTGIGLSIIASFVLAKWQLKIPYSPDLWPIVIVFASITGLTMLIGLLNSREVISKPPLEVLRKEV